MQQHRCSIYIYLIYCIYIINAYLREVNHARFLKRQNLRVGAGQVQSKIPPYWDWRKHGVISDVKDQSSCQCAWAYSVTAGIEAQVAIWLNTTVALSTQMLVDCDETNDGCKGGWTLKAYEFLLKNNGSVFLEDYPDNEEHVQQECYYHSDMKKVPILGFSRVAPDEETMKHYLYKYGPLVAAINSKGMMDYKRGIDKPNKNLCKPNKLDHAILIVGYGVQVDHNYKHKNHYWIIKNSWGPEWGEDGYYRLQRGNNSCGITSDVSIPIIPLYS